MSHHNLSDQTIFFPHAVTIEDVESIAKLWYDVYLETHASLIPPELMKHRTLETFRTRVKDPAFMDGTILAMKSVGSHAENNTEQRLLGFITLRLEHFEVYQLFVAREARYQGIAGELLRRAEESFKSFKKNMECTFERNNIDHKDKDKKRFVVHLHAIVGNHIAKRFYEKNGWKAVKKELFQAEVVVDEHENEGKNNQEKSAHRIKHFPLLCYRIEKELTTE